MHDESNIERKQPSRQVMERVTSLVQVCSSCSIMVRYNYPRVHSFPHTVHRSILDDIAFVLPLVYIILLCFP